MRILLVEDHEDLSLWLQKALTVSGFAVDIAKDGEIALQLLQTENYLLVVLDVSLPRVNGLDVLAQMRKRDAQTPVLLLTANSDVADRVRGLNAGADDYLTKPFDLAELEARIRALLRRSQGQVNEPLTFGDLCCHEDGYFLLHEEPLGLTPREHAVLNALFHRRGRPVSKHQLFEQVFSLSDEVSLQSIELYVHRVRKKLAGSDVNISTLRGLGYRLEQCCV